MSIYMYVCINSRKNNWINVIFVNSFIYECVSLMNVMFQNYGRLWLAKLYTASPNENVKNVTRLGNEYLLIYG